MPLSRRTRLKSRKRTSILSKVDNSITLHYFSYFCFSDLIQGKDRHPEHGEKMFLFQIVANKVNGVDVDK